MRGSDLVRKAIFEFTIVLHVAALPSHTRGAAGDVELSFDAGPGVNGTVRSVAIQPDGKLIIGGAFTTVKGLARVNLARLNADGSGDATTIHL